MSDSSPRWASYRCPVCGHTDGEEVPEQGPVRFRCSHCGVELEGDPPAAGAEHMEVRAIPGSAGEPGEGG